MTGEVLRLDGKIFQLLNLIFRITFRSDLNLIKKTQAPSFFKFTENGYSSFEASS